MNIFGLLLPPWISAPLALLGKLLGSISLKTWLVIGVIAALVLLHFDLEHRAVEAQKMTDAKAEAARDKARAAAQAKVDLAAQQKLDALATQLVQAQLDVQEAQAARDQAAARLAAALKERSNTYVTPIQNARCPDVPRGYLMLRADAAAFANGASDARPSAPTGESLDARSGVSLAPVAGEPDVTGPFLSDTDIAQATAFRDLKQRLADERLAADSLRAACTSIISTLKGDPP